MSCYAAMTIREQSGIPHNHGRKSQHQAQRCLATGVNALNAYITKVMFRRITWTTHKRCRQHRQPDLLLTMSKDSTVLTAKNGTAWSGLGKQYVAEKPQYQDQRRNFKPLLADAVSKLDDVTVINQLNITDYLVNNNKIEGAVGFSICRRYGLRDPRAKKVLIATEEPQAEQSWLFPSKVNTGRICHGHWRTEMTTFEMRFIALRCKDTIAPPERLQGCRTKQINAHGKCMRQNTV